MFLGTGREGKITEGEEAFELSDTIGSNPTG